MAPFKFSLNRTTACLDWSIVALASARTGDKPITAEPSKEARSSGADWMNWRNSPSASATAEMGATANDSAAPSKARHFTGGRLEIIVPNHRTAWPLWIGATRSNAAFHLHLAALGLLAVNAIGTKVAAGLAVLLTFLLSLGRS